MPKVSAKKKDNTKPKVIATPFKVPKSKPKVVKPTFKYIFMLFAGFSFIILSASEIAFELYK
jgi:hypothetical protein